MSNIEKCNNTSVGMIVWKDNRMLLIERKKYPFGFAPPAGHVDDGESYENAAIRELMEEVGIKAQKLMLLIEGKQDNPCRRPNGTWHYWKVYEIKIDDNKVIIKKDEVKKANWYSIEDLKHLARKTEKYLLKEINDEDWQSNPGLEIVCYNWFRELKII